MAINSWLSPKVTDKISECVPFIQKSLVALLKMEPASISDVPTGAKRMTLPNASQWKIEKFDGTNWTSAGKLMHDVDTVDGYHAAITPAKNTIAVRNADGVLQDSITGNAATATRAVALSEINPLSMGGTGSNTAAGARTNLGVPPISHSSTANTYGLGSSTDYGHLKLSDAVDGTESVVNGTASTPKALKAVNDSAVHKTGDEVIGGTKVFTSNPIVKETGPIVLMQATTLEKGTAPSADNYGVVSKYDKSDTFSQMSKLNDLAFKYGADGSITTCLVAYKPEKGSEDATYLGLTYPSSGYPFAYCPTPKDTSGNVATDDNSEKIATTQWAHSAFDGVIKEAKDAADTAQSSANAAQSSANAAQSSADVLATGLANVESGLANKLDNNTVHIVNTWRSSDGLSWCRKWSDGWIEQGGKGATLISGGSLGVLLLTPFSNTEYTVIVATRAGHAEGLTGRFFSVNRSCETTWFSVTNNGWGSEYIGIYLNWYACGY